MSSQCTGCLPWEGLAVPIGAWEDKKQAGNFEPTRIPDSGTFLAELPASTTKFFLSVSLLLLKTRSLYVDQANLELEAIIPPQPSRCWNYTREPPQPAPLLSFIFSFFPSLTPFLPLDTGAHYVAQAISNSVLLVLSLQCRCEPPSASVFSQTEIISP